MKNYYVDAGQHGEAPEADGGKGKGDKDSDPKTNGHKFSTLPLRSKLSSMHLRKCSVGLTS